jgi:hypothetical protein
MNLAFQPDNDLALLSNEWSITIGRLTAKGEAELLRLFGSALQETYGQIIEEKLPDHIQSLLTSLIQRFALRET